MKGKHDHKLRNTILISVIMAPALIFLMALGTSEMILNEVIPEKSIQLWVHIIAGASSFLLSLFCAVRAPQKKFLWAAITGVSFSAFLLLCNLMFFGVGFGRIWPNALTAIAAGMLAGIIPAVKRRKFA